MDQTVLLRFGFGESGGEKNDGAVDLQETKDSGSCHVLTRANRLESHERDLHGQNQA